MVAGLDTTLYSGHVFWTSLGTKTTVGSKGARWGGYAEAGAWFIISLGGGYSFGRDLNGPHIYLGIPFPFSLAKRKPGVMLKVYLRITFRGAHEGGHFYESGLMMNILWFL